MKEAEKLMPLFTTKVQCLCVVRFSAGLQHFSHELNEHDWNKQEGYGGNEPSPIDKAILCFP